MGLLTLTSAPAESRIAAFFFKSFYWQGNSYLNAVYLDACTIAPEGIPAPAGKVIRLL